jgi:hypothetical protein
MSTVGRPRSSPIGEAMERLALTRDGVACAMSSICGKRRCGLRLDVRWGRKMVSTDVSKRGSGTWRGLWCWLGGNREIRWQVKERER